MHSTMKSASIARVHEGMRVVDATGEEVGKVRLDIAKDNLEKEA